MGVFNFFRRDNEDASKNQVADDNVETESNESLLLTALLKGEKIDKNKALSIPAVSSAVDKLSNLVAMLPIKLYQRVEIDGKRKVVEVLDDNRTNVLNVETGDTLDTFQLKKAIAKDYLISKGAYVYIEKKLGEIVSIRYVEPDSVSIFKNHDPIFKDVKYNINGVSYETYNFLTILRSTKNGASGTSIVDEITKSLETAFSTILFELGIAKKGGGKKGFLQALKKLTDDEIKKVKKAWNKYYSNSEENVIILNNGLEFKEGSNSLAELQINERKKTLKDDINDVFHISNKYDETIKDAVIPILSAIESALNRNFLLEKEKGVFYFAFDTKKITRGSLKERYEAYKLAKEAGLSTINEIREEEDKDYIEGLDVISLNLGNVLYDTKTKKYYTPNTGSLMDTSGKKFEGGDGSEDRS